AVKKSNLQVIVADFEKTLEKSSVCWCRSGHSGVDSKVATTMRFLNIDPKISQARAKGTHIQVKQEEKELSWNKWSKS
ncbi:hypothetical protein TYRP_023185, partial [Tyrophagus putrescentiae]